MHDLSKYTVPTSFVGIAVPTKVAGMLVVLAHDLSKYTVPTSFLGMALPTKVVGMLVV